MPLLLYKRLHNLACIQNEAFSIVSDVCCTSDILCEAESMGNEGQVVSDIDASEYEDISSDDNVSSDETTAVSKSQGSDHVTSDEKVSKQAKITRMARYVQQNTIGKQHLLTRATAKKESKLVQNCPGIGKEVEEFVKEHNVGADAWRRTGLLTFDGNTRLKDKVTYLKLQKHLQHISYFVPFSISSQGTIP